MSSTKKIVVSPAVSVGADSKLLLIAGPCQIEGLDHALKIGTYLRDLCKHLGISLVYKSSYDKANRTSMSGARGPGITEGLKVLEQVKKRLDIPVLTDVHTAEEAQAAAAVCDVIQIPAFLCRQTDLLLAAGKTGRTINVKKGQFLAPEDMSFVAQKIASTGNDKVMLCERGSCFGYRDLVVDMRGLQIMQQTGYPVIFDGTHSVQSMGGKGGASGGSREFIPALVRAAAAVGVDGVFLECHDNPATAPSDGATMLRLEEVEPLLSAVIKIRAAINIQ